MSFKNHISHSLIFKSVNFPIFDKSVSIKWSAGGISGFPCRKKILYTMVIPVVRLRLWDHGLITGYTSFNLSPSDSWL